MWFWRYVCTSGSVVEYRLAKARVAGSNPVSCSQRDRKKSHPMDGSFFYVQALPGSNGSNVSALLRSSQSNVSFSPWWSDFGYFQGSDALIVDVNFLGAVLALRIAGSMDKDLLDKLMQDTWSQFRNFGSSIRYAREKDENGYFPCFASFNRLKKDLKAPSTSLRICWAMLEFSSR